VVVVVVVVVVGPMGPLKETAGRRWSGSRAEEDQWTSYIMHGSTFPGEGRAVFENSMVCTAGFTIFPIFLAVEKLIAP
jgi:hypothetical protein